MAILGTEHAAHTIKHPMLSHRLFMLPSFRINHLFKSF
jgi:hypothetical protein